MTRRTFALGAPWALVSAAGCVPAGEVRPPAPLDVRPASGLPETSLPWLSLRDHFVATVGDHAGEGRPLGPLLVLADATFAPHSRFPLHEHRDLEILSIVLDGTLTHHGDQGDGAALPARGVQLISARDGIEHAFRLANAGPRMAAIVAHSAVLRSVDSPRLRANRVAHRALHVVQARLCHGFVRRLCAGCARGR